MIHPWYLDAGWQKKAARYNITQGTTEWDYFVDTVHAAKTNGFRVPCLAGFTILALFGLVVLAASLRNGILMLTNRSSLASDNKVSRAFRKHLSQAPLFEDKHSTVHKLVGSFLTVHAPLRGETLLLLALLVANFVPLVAFYTPYTFHNVSWPNDTFYQVGRYLADRSSILAISQLPILILLSGRNNPVAFLTGASFATCMLFHRWIARLVTVQILIHAIAHSAIRIEKGGSTAYEKLFEEVYVAWGLAAFVALVFMCFFSLRWFRQKSYEWFVITHIIMAIAVIVGVFYHIKLLEKDALYADFIDFVYASIAFWCFDKAVRLFRVLYLNGVWSKGGQFCSSKGMVSLLNGTEDILSISVTLTGRGAKRWMQDPSRVTSGLNIQLWIPRVHPLSSHPFSVAAIEKCGDDVRLQLYVQIKKGITSRLLKQVQQKGGQCGLSMMVEGFYGPQIQTPTTHNQVYVAGGIGITHSISYLQEAIRQGTEAHLIWLTSNPGMIAIALAALKSVATASKLEGESKESPCRQALSIYITRPTKAAAKEQGTQGSDKTLPTVDAEKQGSRYEYEYEDKNNTLDHLNNLHPLLNVYIYSLDRRPVLSELVLPLVAPKRSTLFSCGPAELLDTARSTSRQHNIDYHEEAFAW